MLHTFIYIIIALLGISSYAAGAWKMLRNKYSPSVFSRIVWVLLAINSFVAVVLSGSSASILLGAILLLGNIAICIISFSKGTKGMGNLEYICLVLLAISVLIWIFFRAPVVNLVISLAAHFIGAAPTYKKVWLDPKSEDVTFWFLFFLASALSIFVSDYSSLTTILLPIYFAAFDGSILLLAMRRFVVPVRSGVIVK